MRYSMPESFWLKVKKTKGCWYWKASMRTQGYGRFRETSAHRTSWELHNGPIPRDKIICHRCNNPACVKPEHLYLGSKKDNARDRIISGLPDKSFKLTPNLVKRVKRAYLKAGVTQDQVAAKFNVSRATVSLIVNGKSWFHIK